MESVIVLEELSKIGPRPQIQTQLHARDVVH